MNKLTFANSSQVQGRVEQIALKLAKNVASEDPSVADHYQRLRLAYGILIGQAGIVERLTKLVLTNTTIAQAVVVEDDFGDLQKVPDGDIEYELSSIWTMYATALYGQAPKVP